MTSSPLSVPKEQAPGDSVRREQAKQWFWHLRNDIIAVFENIEREFDSNKAGTFRITPWKRAQGGGGEMGKMAGQVFEKVGVNVSEVWGTFQPDFAANIRGASQEKPEFWACGISLVAHMVNPKVPAVHMNTRMICTQESWFGGGADLTPMVPNNEDTAFFHTALKNCCDRHKDVADYDNFKAWCDKYFFLPHRNEARGVGGIFYDSLDTGDWDADFAFTKDVGKTFHNTYPLLVRKHMHDAFSEDDRAHQLERRGRYVEFNLIHDRGTLFGLKTDGNVDAILMSMPPMAAWS